MEKTHIFFFFYIMISEAFFFPAAEVVKPEESTKQRRDLLLPSPMLSPCFSSDEDSVYSPTNTLIQDFQLDDLFDWDGQQTLGTF